MRQLMRLQLLMVLFFPLVISSCVSVNLGNNSPTKNTYVRFASPKAPYTDIRIESADSAWQNSQTGTTLSYLSVCKDTSDPSLSSMQISSLKGFDNLAVQSEETIPFNEREGRKVVADGSLDGVPVTIRLLLFKKNNCNYTLSMVGTKKRFNDFDQKSFDDFTASFRAP